MGLPQTCIWKLTFHSHVIENTSSQTETSHFWYLVLYHDSSVHLRLTDLVIHRSAACSTASIDTFSLVTRHISLPSLTSSTSVITKPSIPSYHSATPNVKTLTPCSLSYILSKATIPLFINLVIEAYLRTETLKSTTSLTKSGSPCFTSLLAGASLRSAS